MSAALRYPPLPNLRKIQHTLTISAPGFDDPLGVIITAQGNGDNLDILSVDDVSIGMTDLLPDEIWLKNSVSLCHGTHADFCSLRQWLQVVAGSNQDCIDQILSERGEAE